ncbi:MAG: sodium:calcium antiporter [Nanoarchaeota archaeon]
MEIVSLTVIVVASIVIFFTGNQFAARSSRIGSYLGMSPSAKGATLDAISSSLPEFLVALFGVIFFNSFDVGMGTIAGSALFNLLIIPAICVLVAPVAFTVTREVIERDSLFYIAAVFALLTALTFAVSWGFLIPLTFLAIYTWYIWYLKTDSRTFRKENTRPKNTIHPKKDVLIGLLSLAGMSIATYFLTEHAILFSRNVGIHPLIISFTIVATVTSLPDAILSIANARKGNIDDAASNVFGSNIFDILGGLSIPIIIWNILNGPLNIVFERMELIFFLLATSILVLMFLIKQKRLTRFHAFTMLLLFAGFLAYIIHLASVMTI